MGAAMEQADDPWLRTLLPQFLDLTASRQIEIDIERSNLEAGNDVFSAAQEIDKIAHKIAGTAASFGFAGLGTQAQTVESICQHIGSLSNDQAKDAVRHQLLPALDRLSQELDVALVSAP